MTPRPITAVVEPMPKCLDLLDMEKTDKWSLPEQPTDVPMLFSDTKHLGSENVIVMGQHLMDNGNRHLAQIIAVERKLEGKNGAFLVFNVDTVVQRYAQWCENMPRVRPFYAVKCNNDPVLVSTLAKLGAGFDCASREEIDLILDNGLARPREDIVYANTCKTPEYIRHANARGIKRFTFDCVEELVKIKREHRGAQVILRIDVTDPSATRPLDVKFGCHPINDAPRLLRVAKQINMELIGISFHVGSGCQDPMVYRQAISMARKLFNMGILLGHRMHVLDLGGGFPGCENEREFFEEIGKVVSEALDEFFPAANESVISKSCIELDNVQPEAINKLEIIAEPGRYFASAASSVCASVIGTTRVNAAKLTKKADDGETDAYMYYLDDGVYGSFSCIPSRLFTKVPNGIPLFPRQEEDDDAKPTKFLSVVWGPTCDSRDQVEQLCLKPRLQCGDLLFYSDMGAYTRVTATQFNGFARPKDTYYMCGNQTWDMLMQIGGEGLKSESDNNNTKAEMAA